MDIGNAGKVMSGVGAIVAVVGLVVTIVIVAGVFWLLYRIFSGMGRANAERERLLREGMQAKARILNVEMGGMTMTVGVHRHLQLKLTVQVEPSHLPPYQAVVTTMISELQIPQVQPGVMATVRYDPKDPTKVVLEGVGMSAGTASAGTAAAGAPGGAIAIPMGGNPKMPLGAKIGLIVGGIGALIGIGTAVVVTVFVFGLGGFLSRLGPSTTPPSGSSAPASEAPTGNDVCSRAIRCCQTISAGSESASNCSNLGKFGVPASACQSALDGYKRAAKAMGKKCS